MTMFPIEKIRKECPATSNALFFNSAGSSLPSSTAINKILDFTRREAEVGGYKLMVEESHIFDEFYEQASRLINTSPRNIAFTQSATMAFSQAIYSIDWKQGDVILMSELEYVSNVLAAIKLRERFGIEFEFLPCDEHGLVNMDKLEMRLKKKSIKALFLTHIPTNVGVIQDARRAGELCKKHKCIYILDACQSIGHINVDVQELQCDFLSVTGRKFLRGPRGTGFLYVSDRFVDSDASPVCIDLAGVDWISDTEYSYHGNAKRWEMWEKNYSNLLGLTQAISEINKLGIASVEKYNQDLQEHFREVLRSINGVSIVDPSVNNCSIITWRYKDFSRTETINFLESCKVVYSMAMKESALIDMKKRQIDWSVRFSPHFFNTKEEIEIFKDRMNSVVG